MEDIEVTQSADTNPWKIKALCVHDQNTRTTTSKVLEALDSWQASHPEDWKKLTSSLNYAARTKIHTDEKRVLKDATRSGVFEIRANRCKLRLMAFYDTDETGKNLIICATTHNKGKGHHKCHQNTAFTQCAQLRDAYKKQKETSQPK